LPAVITGEENHPRYNGTPLYTNKKPHPAEKKSKSHDDNNIIRLFFTHLSPPEKIYAKQNALLFREIRRQVKAKFHENAFLCDPVWRNIVYV
jgi:hypothetical protein